MDQDTVKKLVRILSKLSSHSISVNFNSAKLQPRIAALRGKEGVYINLLAL